MTFSSQFANWCIHYLWLGVDWLFPPQCAGCGAEYTRWCGDCRRKVQMVRPPICQVCGRPYATDAVCERCLAHPPEFDELRSWAVFGGVVRKAIHRLKYQRDLALGEVFARSLAYCYHQQGWQVDAVIPVPLGLDRMAERGYNQASILARPLAFYLGIQFLPKALARRRETRTQVGLTIRERQDNVRDAFLAQQSLVTGKRVLLVDDVTTTGSTLDACAGALRTSGATHVYCLTLARAISS
jgi:competence protein ComFC